MAKKTKRKPNDWITLAAVVLVLVAGFAVRSGLLPTGQPVAGVSAEPVQDGSAETVTVHYLDVGQGDCELILTPGGNVLIDTGEYEYVTKVVDTLNELQIKKIDVLVATHPHSDHIGGMATIINSFEIGMVIMPRASNNSTGYEKMLLAMKEKGLKAHAPVVGEIFELGGAEFTTLAPNADEYESLNNYSVVLRMTYGRHSFLFTGDAEGVSEREILKNGLPLAADFLKVGHHGSKTSSTKDFLEAVVPGVSLIGVGKANSYGHPNQDVLDRLTAYGEVYRTDRHGDIVVETDGERYRVSTEK